MKPRTANKVKGEAALYIKRSKALHKLNLSLAEFRKVCILKGIFPRIPKKKIDASKSIYYSTKDINRIANDPLLTHMTNNKILERRKIKAVKKKDYTKAEIIDEQIEELDISNILKERYPTFIEAIKDMDDALSTIALFSTMESTYNSEIDGEIIKECKDLIDQWYAFVMETKILEKVFASIKGFYFQVEILSVKVTWLQPYELPKSNSAYVDYRVMSTFLLLYRSLIKFILYKLYTMAGYSYPPQNANNQVSSNNRFLNLTLNKHNNKAISNTSLTTNSEIKLFNYNDNQIKLRKLFENQVFWVGSENAYHYIVFLLKCCGAKKVGWPIIKNTKNKDLLDIVNEYDADITHQICDMPIAKFNEYYNKNIDYIKNRIVVQPQWLFDCINTCNIIPQTLYKIGTICPPHLSPFDNSYTPAYRLILDKWSGKVDEEQLSDVEEVDNELLRRAELTMSRRKRDLYNKLKQKDMEQKKHIEILRQKAEAIKVNNTNNS